MNINSDIFIKESNKGRMIGTDSLSPEEIRIIRKGIEKINADKHIFIFNNSMHKNLCYAASEDRIYVGRNIFPNPQYAFADPRARMSIPTFLAHMYYGHRPFRNEYLEDEKNGMVRLPKWQDEVRASINAAKIAPGIIKRDQYFLLQDAFHIANENGFDIVMGNFMKKVFFTNSDVKIIGKFNEKIIYVPVTDRKYSVSDRLTDCVVRD